MGKTLYQFRYSLNFRNLVGSSNSFDGLAALRDILAGEAQRVSMLLGRVETHLMANDQYTLANDLEHLKGFYVGLLESDVMAIDAYLAARHKNE